MMHQNEQAEISILSHILHNPTCRAQVFDKLTVQDFTGEMRRRLFLYLLKAWENNLSFQDREMLARIYGYGPIVYAFNNNPAIPWQDALGILITCTIKRRIRETASAAIEVVDQGNTTLEEMRDAIGDLVPSARDDRVVDMPPSIDDISGLFLEYVNSAKNGHAKPISWGIDTLDVSLLLPHTLTVVAARPSIGKTAMVCSCINRQLDAGMAVGFMCLEMPAIDIFTRLVSQRVGVSFERLKLGQTLTIEELEKFKTAVAFLKGAPLFLFCGENMSPAKVCGLAGEWVHNGGIKILYVDYLQDLRFDRRNSLREETGDCCRRFKYEIARKYQIPVVLLSQLNRDAEGQKPSLSHLKESGDIEQVSDIIWFLDRLRDDENRVDVRGRPQKPYRIHVSDHMGSRWINIEPRDGVVAAILAKQRNGPTCTTFLGYDPVTMLFKPWDGFDGKQEEEAKREK
jgi:replicative DNA helicase